MQVLHAVNWSEGGIAASLPWREEYDESEYGESEEEWPTSEPMNAHVAAIMLDVALSLVFFTMLSYKIVERVTLLYVYQLTMRGVDLFCA